MSKNVVKMKHENSSLTISVVRSQVQNAKYYGWFEVDDEPAKKPKSKREVKKHG